MFLASVQIIIFLSNYRDDFDTIIDKPVVNYVIVLYTRKHNAL